MMWQVRSFAPLAVLAILLVWPLVAANDALAQKQGGTLRVYHRDSPASMSIHEEGTVGVIMPMMGVFNNLVIFDQQVPQNSMQSIVPELATSWAWSEDGTQLTFKLRDGVKWHDGKPFTAEDVKCTFDLLTNQGKEKLRLNYRETWWVNLAKTTTEGEHEATLHLKRPQPAVLALLASGDTPIYPCHVSPRDMRQHPIGTGPFKFVDYKPNQHIKLARNPDYWKPGRPFLDGIEYTIIPNRSTAILAFVAGKFDMTFPYEVTIPLLKDIKTQSPQATCEVGMAGESIGVLINRTVAPFDNAELRRAMALTFDRKSFIDILGQGEGELGGALLPPPEGVWGMPLERLLTLPGYSGDVQKSREEARAKMRGLGYGRDKRLPVKNLDTQSRRLSRSGRDPDRPAKGNIHRRRARDGRDRQLGAQADAQGFQGRAQCAGGRGRRPRGLFLPKLRLQLCPQLSRLLRQGIRQHGRSAIDGGRSGEAQANSAGCRLQTAAGSRAPGHLSLAGRDLLAARGQRAHDDDQQPIQWLAP
jgi:peptide/nickel transport system substrate-binding protein